MATPKLILSKKGFDTENGGGPSPILGDRRMIPLPVPERRPVASCPAYSGLRHDGGTYADLLEQLGYATPPATPAHLDPDLVSTARPRDSDWIGMFGQVDQAESHLANEGVGPGCLFLFWGWYSHAGENLAFYRRDGFSSLFGYLEVDYAIDVGRDPVPAFAQHHPHFSALYPRQRNRVYVARRQLSWNPAKPGWGVFRYSPRLRLSVEGKNRSHWRLPGCFHPAEGCVLTFNTDREHWGEPGDLIDVRIPARGQEFVCSLSGAVASWAKGMIDGSEVWSPAIGPEVNPAPAPAQSAAKPSAMQLELHKIISTEPRQIAPTQVEPIIASLRPIPPPLPGERQVSYGDRLLWYQLGLQINGKRELMLTEAEYVAAVCRYFPDAVVHNVRGYRSYFNGRHKSMGFREVSAMPVPVEFAPPARNG